MKKQIGSSMRGHGYLRYLILNAVVFCLIPVLVVVIFFVYKSYSNMVSTQYETAYQKTYAVSKNIDKYIEAMTVSAIRIMTEKRLGHFYLHQQTYHEIEAIDTMKNIALVVPFADEVGLYYGSDPTLYTSKGKYNPSVYAERVLSTEAESFFTALASIQKADFVNCKMAPGIAVFYYPGTMFAKEGESMGVLFMITTSSLLSTLSVNLPEDYELAAIYNPSDYTVFYNTKYLSIKLSELDFKPYGEATSSVQYTRYNENNFISCTSPYGYRIVTVMKTQLFMRKVEAFRNSIFLIGALMLVLCTLLILIMTWESYRPVMHLLRRINNLRHPDDAVEKIEGRQNELSLISTLFESNVREKDSYRRELMEQRDVLASHLLEKLLDRIALTDHEKTVLGFQGTYYFVAAASIAVFSQLNAMRNLISSLRSEQDKIHILEKPFSGHVVFICSLPNGDLVSRLARMRELRAAIHADALMLGIGSASTSLEDIYLSYLEAAIALELCSDVDPFICFDKRAQLNEAFSHESIVRIGKIAINGNEQLTQSELDKVFDIAKQKKNPIIVQRHFCFELISELDNMLKRLLLERKINSDGMVDVFNSEFYTKMLINSNSSEMHDIIIAMLKDYCTTIRHMIHIYDEKNAVLIIDFVNANFADPEMCLEMICSRYNVMNYTVSRIFKDKTGSSFRKYLINKRIDHAKELLFTTNMSIGEIAVLVGFGSANYFTRIFKSIEGVVPSIFRDKKIL